MTDANGSDEEGTALVSVMLIGMLIALAGLWLAESLVVEYRAIEDSLTDVRAYWAGLGEATYVLSRTAQSGACNGKTCPVPASGKNPGVYKSSANAYVKEVTSGSVALQNWAYPDVNASYVLTVSQTVCDDPLAPSGNVGEMLLVTSVGGSAKCPSAPPATGSPTPTSCPAPSAPPAKALLALRTVKSLRPLEVRYCLTAPGASSCGSGPGATTSGANLITSIHRPSC